MKLTADELMNDTIIMKKPYYREGSYVYIKAVEKQNIELVKMYVQKCKYLLFDVDHVRIGYWLR